MYQFAKVFEVNDEQLLVVIDYTYRIWYRTAIATDEHWFESKEDRNKYFASFDQDAAVKMYEEMTKG